jgi:hypothetical protein
MSSYLVYVCQSVKNRAGLERYWQEAPAVYPENIDVLVAYGPSEVLDADQDERVAGESQGSGLNGPRPVPDLGGAGSSAGSDDL